MKRKTLFSHKPFTVWFVVAVILVVLVAAADFLALGYFNETVRAVLGGMRPVYDSATTSLYKSEKEISSKEESLAYANSVTETICEEGFVLLKNEDAALPLRSGSTVHVFGKNSVDLVISGSGSAAGDTSSAKTIYDSLEKAGFSYNETLKKFYENTSQSGDRRSDPSGFVDGKEVVMETGETPWEKYDAAEGLMDSITGKSEDAAVVVISRMGGESYDLPKTAAEDESRHYLELDANEEELIRQVCGLGFESVTVVVNSANTMELGFLKDDSLGKIDACLVIGRPGNEGIMALGSILSGAVNPSGHTVDTWTADFTQDPSYTNFAALDTAYDDYYYSDYAEGIYTGYRYWETRALYEDESWYEEHVVYPFGYGLSYTTFSWELEDASSLEGQKLSADETYTIKVKVTNTGDTAGKDVVQLYAGVPYTEGGIEKPYKVLCGYAKTEVLEPGASESVELVFEPYSIASYDYTDANKNGFSGYELENGAYTLFVNSDVHTDVLTVSFEVAEKNEYKGIVYTTNPLSGTNTEVVNRFEDTDDELGLGTEQEGRAMSRTDWILPARADKTKMSDGLLEKLQDNQSGNPLQAEENSVEMPVTQAEVKTTLQDLHYDESGALTDWVDFEDDRWDEVLDALSFQEMLDMYNEGQFKSNAIESIGKPQTLDSDGPTGYVNFMSMSGAYDNTCVYCCETVVASTWNNDLAELFGEAIGEEGLQGDGNGTPYSGIYAPGLNLHRSPFGGRNGEYFSEDSYLSGYLAAAEISGARSRGVYMTMKHFAVNEQETYRQSNGLINWIDEQTLREVYLKPFEIAVTKGGATGVMTSFTRTGSKWCGGDYRLLTEVLKEEWGFHGIVISDYNVAATKYMNTKQEAYAGGTLSLASDDRLWSSANEANANDVTVLRKNTKDVLYAVTNSNARTAIGYKQPLWELAAYAVEGVLAVLLVLWGVLVTRGALRKRRTAEK